MLLNSHLICICRLLTVDRTATANLDYQPIDQEIIFEVGVALIEVQITINDDSLVEGNEEFLVNLTSRNGTVTHQTLTITITDNDCEWLMCFFCIVSMFAGFCVLFLRLSMIS